MELENVSLKDKIIRAIVAFFLFILVSGLIITFLPGDAEKSFFDVISGRSNLNAGKIGSDSIPMDYFQAAQRDCFFQYRNIAPSLAEDPSTLQSCAFQTIRSLVVTNKSQTQPDFPYPKPESVRNFLKRQGEFIGNPLLEPDIPKKTFVNPKSSINRS